MNLLQAEHLSKSYGTRILFKDLSFGLHEGQKTALVARNGSGKTTLLNILCGLDSPDEGEVVFRRGLKVGLLEQDPKFTAGQTVMQSMLDEDNPLMQVVLRYELALEAHEAESNPKSKEELQKASDEMDAMNAWTIESQARSLLTRFGLQDWHKKVDHLSGGESKRLSLCRLLLNKPDVLVLDEPTNHLDLDMIEWLESHLSRSECTLLMVTHDRYFLDNVCNDILEMENGNLYRYKGNYSEFLEKKAERDAAELSSVEKARNLYTRELEWMRRQPKARGTKAKSRVDAFDDIKDKAFSRRDEAGLTLELRMSRIGGKIMEIKNIAKKQGDKQCIKNFTYTFKKGERVGIVGPNGAGKTTFLDIIMGNLQPDAGQINTGESMVMGYFSQYHMKLPMDKKMIDVVKDIAEIIPLEKGGSITAAQLLQKFLFKPDTHQTPVHKLSGGERRRLQLITVLMKNPNFLVLDEPTNDLDLLTLGVLEEFLSGFPGILVIVSHDRYFMDRLVDHLFIFDGKGDISDFNGNYTDYRLMLDEKEAAGRKEIKELKESSKASPEKNKQKLSFKEKLEYEKLEAEIAALEEEKKGLESEMAAGTLAYQDYETKNKRFNELDTLIAEKTDRWLELAERA